MDITIRNYRAGDASALTELFYDAVECLAGECYSEQEIRAWAPRPIPYEEWRQRLDQQRPWVAETDHRPIGFVSLLPDGLIGLAYVDPAYQRQGVASQLCRRAEDKARALGLERLFVDASHAARPLFEQLGYTLTVRNLNRRNGQILVNWRMVKSL